MLPRQILASLVIGLSVLLLIVRLVQKGRLDKAYCWLWLAVGIGMVMVVVWYDGLLLLSRLIGARVPTTTLFLLGMVVLLLMCLQFSLAISTQRRQIKRLTQQVALLAERLDAPPFQDAGDRDEAPDTPRSEPPA